MEEFELFIDKKLNVQKNSILITLDDGGFAYNAKNLFTEYEMNISMFIVSSWFDPKSFETEYVEVHSHSDNLHETGICPPTVCVTVLPSWGRLKYLSSKGLHAPEVRVGRRLRATHQSYHEAQYQVRCQTDV